MNTRRRQDYINVISKRKTLTRIGDTRKEKLELRGNKSTMRKEIRGGGLGIEGNIKET